MSNTTSFIYCDAKGNITAREVVVLVNNDDVLYGICSNTNQFKTFKKERILELIDPHSNDIQNRLSYHIENPPVRVQTANTSSHQRKPRPSSSSIEICFTGFKAEERNQLESIATSKEFAVRQSVTANLSFLCCGENAGPAKTEKARRLGAILLNKSEFQKLIETGEIPEYHL